MIGWIVGGIAALIGYKVFTSTPTNSNSAPNVAAGFKVGDFVLVNTDDPNLLDLPVKLATLTLGPGQLPVIRAQITSLLSPQGRGFVLVSFADPRISAPGIVSVPLTALTRTA